MFFSSLNFVTCFHVDMGDAEDLVFVRDFMGTVTSGAPVKPSNCLGCLFFNNKYTFVMCAACDMGSRLDSSLICFPIPNR